MNNTKIYGTKAITADSDFDEITRKDYVDGEVSNLLLQSDGYKFKVSGLANAFAIEKLADSSQPFII